MEIPCGNFFEVTINSNKLYSFILEINKQIQSQQIKTDDLAKAVTAISTTLAQKLKKLSEEADIELQKIRRSNQQENNYLRLYMKDADKKAGEKLEELENSMMMMSNRICKVKEELQEDLSIKLSYLEKKITNNPALAEVEKTFAYQISKLHAHFESMQQRQDKIDHTLENDYKKTVQFNQDMLEKIKITEIQRKNDSQKLLSLGNSFKEGVTSRSRKRLKTHRTGTFFENSEDMSNIVHKIEEFEQRLQQTDPGRGMLSQSKVVKTTENIVRVGSKNNLGVSQREIKQKEFEQVITGKLDKIEELAHRRVFQLEKQLSKNANKHEIVDEHISILSRKIEKEKIRIHELTQSIKRFEEKKIDERVIDGLKTAIKKLSKEFEEGLEIKLNREVYEKEKSRVNERIFFLSEMVTEKAEKSQVKKGFTFFQEKIKQIIIVLAEERNSVKDGAGKRMPFKCLSCDKELQISEPNCRLSHNHSSNSRNSIRCSTNQIRKRIRLMNNSLIPSED